MSSSLPRRRDDDPPAVDVYVRLSRNPDGDLERLDAQEADCRAVAQRRGWTVGQVHRDDSLSAWKRGVRRPGWDALLDRLKNHQTDGVICWHTDRLLRQPRDLELLIDIGEREGLLVASAYGENDLSNSDHRMIMRIQAATAAKSSDDTSRRIRRRFETKRETGMSTGGARPFGFPGDDRASWPRNAKGQPVPPRDEHGERIHTPVPVEQVERERAAIETACQEVMDRGKDVSLAAIAARWNAAELRTATGAEWTTITVRAVLMRPRNAGLIEHNGAVVGRSADPIVSEDVYATVRAVFNSRRRGRPTGERSLASGLIQCGECGHTLTIHPAGTYRDGRPRRQYACGKVGGGCDSIAADAAGVDAVLRAFTLAQLGNPQHAAKLSSSVAAAVARRDEVTVELDRARSTLDALGDRLGRGEIELTTFDAAVRPLRERIARLEAERDELLADRVTEVPAADADALATEWDTGSNAERRTLLATALRGYRVRVHRATSRGVFDPSRVEIERVSAP